MTNQIDSSSPFFKGISDGQKPSMPEGPSIRTMNDDLMSLKNNPAAQEFSPNRAAPFSGTELPSEPLEEPGQLQQTSSPFLKDSGFSRPSAPVSYQTPEVKGEAPSKDIYFSEKPSTPTNFAYKITLIAIFFLALALIGLIGYYFLVVKKQPQSAPVITEETPVEETVPVETIETTETPKAKVNYLPLDVATFSPEEIKAAIISLINKTEATETASFNEFKVVDTNNNPIGFPVFAAATKINLPATILNELDQDFSLFIYKNNNLSRIALSVTTKENNTLPEKMLAQEKTLPTDLEFLFLESKPILSGNVFKSGAYKDASVRYLNFSSPSSTSIDYSIFKNSLLIGTCQDALRMAVDNLSLEKVEPEIQPLETSLSQ